MPFLPCKYPLFRCSYLHSCDAIRDICKINSSVLWYPFCGSFLVSLSRTSESSVCFDFWKVKWYLSIRLVVLKKNIYISYKVPDLSNDSWLHHGFNKSSFTGINHLSFYKGTGWDFLLDILFLYDTKRYSIKVLIRNNMLTQKIVMYSSKEACIYIYIRTSNYG